MIFLTEAQAWCPVSGSYQVPIFLLLAAYFFQEERFPKKKKKNLIRWGKKKKKTTKDFTFNKNSVSLKRHI